jgi:hypothetical protein
MKKALFSLAAASVLALGVAGTPNAAQAGCGWGCGVGIGVGAFALGAIVASPRPAYAWGPTYYPAPGYVVYSGYYAGPPVGCPGGYWARRPLYDQWGNQVGWSQPRFFCP